MSVLLEGPAGAGKSALAATAAIESGFPFVKVVSPEAMVGYMEQAKGSAITKIFEDAYKSPLSIVILVRLRLACVLYCCDCAPGVHEAGALGGSGGIGG